MKRIALSVILALSAAESRALTITDGFSSRAGYASGTAVWNQELGKIHPSLEVVNFKFGYTPADALAIDVGDGSHGPFDNSTYASFSVGGVTPGNVITIDTTIYPELKVTKFELDKNWYIETVGPNPLVIRSLSHVRILGEIRCSGEDGGDAVGATGGAGGLGHCGGHNGGAGGAALNSGSDGLPFAGSMTGGKGGDYVPLSFVGGGGGGAWSSVAPSDGPNGSLSGGQAGAYSPDPEFLTIDGGGGGGGGSGDGTAGGGGGGGGGGVVRIFAVGDLDFGSPVETAVGFIFVNGGNGGDSPSAGPGGGGGGGSVQIFVGGGLNFYNTSPSASEASSGSGGSGGAAGAQGGLGRSWFGSGLGKGGPGNYSPSEEFPVNQSDVNYVQAQQAVVTTIYDLGSTNRRMTDMALSPVLLPDLTLEVAGSNDGFAADDTGWQTTAAAIAGKRFVRFQIKITATDPVAPAMVDSMSATFSVSSIDLFSFRSAGCGSLKDGRESAIHILPVLFMFLIFVGLKIQAQRKLSRK